MKICLYLDRGRILQWHHWLSEALRNSGNDVHIRFSGKALPLPRAYETLFALEKAIFNVVNNGGAMDAIEATVLSAASFYSLSGEQPFDVVINLASDVTSIPRADRMLTPCFYSVPSVFGAFAAL